jgi:hypothetical protein
MANDTTNLFIPQPLIPSTKLRNSYNRIANVEVVVPATVGAKLNFPQQNNFNTMFVGAIILVTVDMLTRSFINQLVPITKTVATYGTLSLREFGGSNNFVDGAPLFNYGPTENSGQFYGEMIPKLVDWPNSFIQWDSFNLSNITNNTVVVLQIFGYDPTYKNWDAEYYKQIASTGGMMGTNS